MELTNLTATGAARLIAAREISSVELTQALLRRIDARNADVRAFCHVDPEFSLAEAARADAQAARSPLHGVPFAVKDVIDTKDLPTEYGTPIHRGHQPDSDARCVALMRAAGAVLLGRLVSTEYAMFSPNETRHPLNLAHTPGGSSSGTGAAVCDRMVPIAFGNQTAGSLIRPAAYCGVYGLKPTHGTTDGSGILPLQPYFDTLGYMARSIEDLQHFFSIVAERDHRAAWDPERRPHIGLCKTFQWEFADAESRSVLAQAGEAFRAGGATVVPFELPPDYADLVAVHRRILYAGIARSLGRDYARAQDKMTPRLCDIIEEGAATSTSEYEEALALAERCRATVNETFADFDVLVCPSAPGEAPLGRETGSPIFQVSWTLLGVPCLNLPIGLGPKRLPVGVQLIGRRHDDKTVLALGRHLMREVPIIQA